MHVLVHDMAHEILHEIERLIFAWVNKPVTILFWAKTRNKSISGTIEAVRVSRRVEA
jgi:hypothetical protein